MFDDSWVAIIILVGFGLWNLTKKIVLKIKKNLLLENMIVLPYLGDCVVETEEQLKMAHWRENLEKIARRAV